MDNRAITRDELARQIAEVAEMLGDTEAQHRSETAVYGDSWPGAQLEIADLRRYLRELEEEYDERFPPEPKPLDPAPEENDEIPF